MPPDEPHPHTQPSDLPDEAEMDRWRDAAAKAAADLLAEVPVGEDSDGLTQDYRQIIQHALEGPTAEKLAGFWEQCPRCQLACISRALAAELAYTESLLKAMGGPCGESQVST
jgi:hypothetical protein